MNILNYISLLLILFTLRVIGDPLLLYFRIRRLSPHGAGTINATMIKRIQQGSFSNLFLLTKSSKQGQEAICLAAGSLVTVANRVLSQEYQDGFVNYYKLSETYISHFKWATQDLETFHRMKMNKLIIYFYDEETKKRTQMPILDVNMKCGLDFAEMILKIRLKSLNHMGILIGHPSNINFNNMLHGSYLIFIPPNDPLEVNFIRPNEVRLTLELLIAPKVNYTQIPLVINSNAMTRKRNPVKHFKTNNEELSDFPKTKKLKGNSTGSGSSLISELPGPSSQSRTEFESENLDEEEINALIDELYDPTFGMYP